MMSSEQICQLADEIADQARENDLEPLVFESLHDVDRRFSKVPNLGSYRPDGWTLAEWPLVDKTGMDDSGPAMSLDSFLRWVKSHLTDAKTSGYAIIEEGQFQVVIGRFERA